MRFAIISIGPRLFAAIGSTLYYSPWPFSLQLNGKNGCFTPVHTDFVGLIDKTSFWVQDLILLNLII